MPMQAHLLWIDKARRIIAPELECLVVIWRHFDVAQSTHERISTGELSQSVNRLGTVVGTRCFATTLKRVVWSDETRCVATLNEFI